MVNVFIYNSGYRNSGYRNSVSILIQVVNVFILGFERGGNVILGAGLNPYSGGKCIHIESSLKINWGATIVSILIQVVNVFIFILILLIQAFSLCLNPYSGGKCIHIRYVFLEC